MIFNCRVAPADTSRLSSKVDVSTQRAGGTSPRQERTESKAGRHVTTSAQLAVSSTMTSAPSGQFATPARAADSCSSGTVILVSIATL